MPPQLGSSAEVGLAAAWPAWFYAFATRSLMQIPDDWKNALGILSVAMAVVAAIIYVVQTFRGEIRPHPLSWFLFGTLSATGYWVTRTGRPAGQLDAYGDDDHLLFVRRGERHAGRTKLFKAGMGVRRRRRGGLHPLSFHQGGQCGGRARDNRRRSRLWSDVCPGLGLSEKGQRYQFCAQRREVRPLAHGDGADFIRYVLLPRDTARPERGGFSDARGSKASRGVTSFWPWASLTKGGRI